MVRVQLVTRSGRELLPGGLDVRVRVRAAHPAQCAYLAPLRRRPVGGPPARSDADARRRRHRRRATRARQGSTVDDLKRALHEASLKKQVRARAAAAPLRGSLRRWPPLALTRGTARYAGFAAHRVLPRTPGVARARARAHARDLSFMPRHADAHVRVQ